MAERQERLRQIDQARDNARELANAQATLDELLGQLTGQTHRLGEEWDNPAAGEIQGIVASAMRQMRDASAMLGAFAQRARAAADEADRHLDDDPPTPSDQR